MKQSYLGSGEHRDAQDSKTRQDLQCLHFSKASANFLLLRALHTADNGRLCNNNYANSEYLCTSTGLEFKTISVFTGHTRAILKNTK